MTDLGYFKEFENILCCPACGGTLRPENETVRCGSCNQEYPVVNGIPQLFWRKGWDSKSKDVTETVKSFYEGKPFPNYDDFDDVSSLIRKSNQGVFARLLDEQIPYGTFVLDCGCGTGQLSNFLSVSQRTVFGADMSMSSLNLAQQFKEKNSLNRVNFVQMNIFSPVFRPESFHLVISNGVLHHTGDPQLAFQTISKLVKPGGYILIGLYHKYGRIFTDFRRFVFHLTGNRFKFLDPRLLDERIAVDKRDAWFADQYKNPHESKHTIGEVLDWLKKAGFRFIKSIPKSIPGTRFSSNEKLFEQEKPGNAIQRFLVEFPMMFSGASASEGGFFIVIGRKA